MPFSFDANNFLLVDVAAGGGSGSNAAAGPTGSPVPTDADYIGINVGGNLVGVSAGNPLPITGSISATNPSVSSINSPIPSEATLIGYQDAFGNLQRPIAGGAGLPIQLNEEANGDNQPSPGWELIVGGEFKTTPTTITSGNVSPLQLDSSGNLLVNVKAGGSGGNASVGTDNTTAPTSSTQIGSQDGTGKLQAASVTNPVPVTVISQGANTNTGLSEGFIGNPAPPFACLVGFKDVLGNLQVPQPTLGIPVDITNSSATVSVTDAVLDACVTGTILSVSDATLESGLLQLPASSYVSPPAGPVMYGAATTAAPSYGNKTTNPLSLTPAGALRVDGSAATQPVSGTVTANQGTAAATTAGWPVVGGQTAETTAAWTSATTVNTALALTVTGYNSVNVTLNQGSTITGGVVTFEASDTVAGTNWYLIQGAEANAFVTGTTYALQQSVNQAWDFDVSGWVQFRVRLSTVITGTGTVNVGVAAQAMSAVPEVSVGGTVTANAGTGSFTVAQATGSNLHAVLDSGSTTAVTQATAANLNATVVPGASAIFEVSPTTAANTNSNPFFNSITDGTTKATVIAATAALKTDLSSVAGTATVTAASGVQRVGIAGNANATLDSTIGAATAPTNAVATSSVYQTTVPSLTAGQAVAAQCDVTGSQFVDTEGRKKTYSTFASFTPVAGDIAGLPGNATTTVRVTRIEVSLSTTGTAGIEQVQLIKRSAADTAGTSANMTVVPHDANFAAASSVPLNYTAAPTPGTAVGAIRGVQFFDESATVTGANTWLWEFGTRGGASAIVLRGTTQVLYVNLAGVVATQTATVSFEWTEDNS